MNDAIDLSTALVVNAPADIASWPITRTITQLTMRTPEGLSFDFDQVLPEAWKWRSNPEDPEDNYQYTVWPVVQINGQWVTSGIIQMWQGKEATGAPLLSDFAKNWVYDDRWGPLAHHQVSVGEVIGFFVSAGNGRGQPGVSSVRERSNVVLVHVPAGDQGIFRFDAPPVVLPPVVDPPVTNPPQPPQGDRLEGLLANLTVAVADLTAAVQRLVTTIESHQTS